MLSIVVAVGKNLEIGKDNKLLWHIPEDLKHFKQLTNGKTIIMGKNAYLSIGRPLPNRKNIVLTDDDSLDNEKGIVVYNDIKKCISENSDAFVIGGASIYSQMIKYCDELHISHVDREFLDADTYFPQFIEEFEKVYEKQFENFVYRVYKRKNKS
ncbi:dihydrofolate reductase [Caviibacter abscessus]|uniref:dihydrofolate reductase n=1 Tax=Caviibacter abscessus TaxID=1766719 RepID=UPI000829D027|nr:dihydrofolate reductase [Caviibacter abscessus]